MNLRRAIYCAVVMLAAIPGLAAAQTAAPKTVDAVVDRIVAQEKAEMQMLHQYSPLVETYIQNMRPDNELGQAPVSDQHFLGRVEFGRIIGGDKFDVNKRTAEGVPRREVVISNHETVIFG